MGSSLGAASRWRSWRPSANACEGRSTACSRDSYPHVGTPENACVLVDPSASLDVGLCKTRPDAIPLDVGMPGIDGIETLRRLKAAPRLSAIPVLMVTGKSEAMRFSQA